MPTCNITTSVSATCPPISSVNIEIYALGTIDGYPVGTTAGTLLASGTANDDTFTVTDVLPQAWHVTNATAVDIVSALSGTYGSFDINQNVLPEDIQICYTVTDGCGTSDQVCDTAWSCAAVPFTITSAVGVPGTEEGTVTYTSGDPLTNYGPGPYPVFREYDVTFSNGLTAHVRSDGTTANQMLWMATDINTGEITYRKQQYSTSPLSNGSNVDSLWDDRNTEGAIVTWTFDQPVEKLAVLLEDFDSHIFAAADAITPEATHWQHLAGFADGLGVGIGINPNGVYQYIVPDPSALTGLRDENNDMLLYWDSPVTTISMRINERARIVMTPTALYTCEIPPEATEAVYVPVVCQDFQTLYSEDFTSYPDGTITAGNFVGTNMVAAAGEGVRSASYLFTNNSVQRDVTFTYDISSITCDQTVEVTTEGGTNQPGIGNWDDPVAFPSGGDVANVDWRVDGGPWNNIQNYVGIGSSEDLFFNNVQEPPNIQHTDSFTISPGGSTLEIRVSAGLLENTNEGFWIHDISFLVAT